MGLKYLEAKKCTLNDFQELDLLTLMSDKRQAHVAFSKIELFF